jgi:hypothetical protein
MDPHIFGTILWCSVFAFICGRMARKRGRLVAGWVVAGAVFGLLVDRL